MVKQGICRRVLRLPCGRWYSTQWGLSLPGLEHPLPSLHEEQEVCAGC